MHAFFTPTDDRFTVTGLDFTITYLRVRELAREATPNSPQAVGYVAAFARVLERAEHDRQKNSRYVYREAAQGLCVFLRPEAPADLSRLALKNPPALLLRRYDGSSPGRGPGSRRIGYGTAGLPGLFSSPADQFPLHSVAAISGQTGRFRHPPPLARTHPGHPFRTESVPGSGHQIPATRGAARMPSTRSRLDASAGRHAPPFFRTFRRPDPSRHGRFPGLPNPRCGHRRSAPWKLGALLFGLSRTILHTPTTNVPENCPLLKIFLEIMGRNARHMGTLMALGLTHTAPIPLFHNRVQQGRRRDAGTYQWHRMGRLDQWLASCRHPNFGLSGLRDFEHIEPHQRQGHGPVPRHGHDPAQPFPGNGQLFPVQLPGAHGTGRTQPPRGRPPSVRRRTATAGDADHSDPVLQRICRTRHAVYPQISICPDCAPE